MSKNDDKAKVRIILEKLTKTGIDNLVAQILEAFRKEYPQYTGYDFPSEFLRVFWAHEYDIVPSMTYLDHEIEKIVAQVEGKLFLEYRLAEEERRLVEREHALQAEKERILKAERERALLTEKERALPAEPSKSVNLEFQKKSVDELAEEAFRYLEKLHEQNPGDLDLLNVFDINEILQDFRGKHYPGLEDNFTRIKRRKVAEAVHTKMRIKKLSKEEKQKLEEFQKKTCEELADEIASFFEKLYPSSLFDDRLSSPNAVFKEFWSKRYPFLHDLYLGEVHEKRIGAQRLAIAKLPEVKKRVFECIVKDFVEWAENKNKTSVTHNEILNRLKEKGLYFPKAARDILYADINERLTDSMLV